MKVFDELIYGGIRTQYIKWNDLIWSVLSNDRFDPNDFKIKIYCEICGPKKYVPKVLLYRGHRICTACLTRMVEILQVATFADCEKTRKEKELLEKELKENKT